MMGEPTEHDEMIICTNGMQDLPDFLNGPEPDHFITDPALFQLTPGQGTYDDNPAAENRPAPITTASVFNTSNNSLFTMKIDFGLQPQLEPKLVVVVRSKIIRFRYKSELSNRKLGKEELVVIRLPGYEGSATILLHTVDKDNKKAHPYMLVGENCQDGMFIASENFSHANNYECVCKATLLVPTRKEYTKGLQDRRKMAQVQNITRAEMLKDDYWNTNKNIKECKDFVLFVEVRVNVNGYPKSLYDYSPILSNAKDGKNFEIYKVSPCSAPCSGISSQTNFPVAVLTKTSFVPNDNVQVIFEDEGENWIQASAQVNIIKNCIEFAVPPYKDENLDDPRTVKMKLIDRQKDMETVAYDFIYEPLADQVQAKRRRKLPPFSVPGHVMEEANKHRETHKLEQRKPPLKPQIKKYLQNRNRHGTTFTPTMNLPQLTLKQENKSPPLTNPCGSEMSSTVMIKPNSGALYVQSDTSAVKAGGAAFQTGLVSTQFTSSPLVPSGHSMAEENYPSQNELSDIDQLISLVDQRTTTSSAPVTCPGTAHNDYSQKGYDTYHVKEEPGNQSCMMATEQQNPEKVAKVNQIIDFLKDTGPDGKQKAESILAGNFDDDIAAILQQSDNIPQTQVQTVFLNSLQDSSSNVRGSAASNIQPQASSCTVTYLTDNSASQSTASSVQINNFVQLPTVNSDFLGSHLLDAFDANDLEIDSHDLDAVRVGDNNNYRFVDDFDLETDCDPGTLNDVSDESNKTLKPVDLVIEKGFRCDDKSENSPEVIEDTLEVSNDTADVIDDSSTKVRKNKSEFTENGSEVSKDTPKLLEGTAQDSNNKSVVIEDKSEVTENSLEVNEDKSKVTENSLEVTEDKSEVFEDCLEVIEDKSEITEDKSEVIEDKSEVIEDKSEVTEDKSEVIEDKSEVTEDKSEVFEDCLEVIEDKSEVSEDKSVVTEDKSEVTENRLEVSEDKSDVNKDVTEDKQNKLKVNESTSEVSEGSSNFNEGVCEVNEDISETDYNSSEFVKDKNITSGDTSQITDTTSEVVVDQKPSLVNVSREGREMTVEQAKDSKHQDVKNDSSKAKPVAKPASQTGKRMDELCNDIECEMKDLTVSYTGNKGKHECQSVENVSLSNIEKDKTGDRNTDSDSVSESLEKLKL